MGMVFKKSRNCIAPSLDWLEFENAEKLISPRSRVLGLSFLKLGAMIPSSDELKEKIKLDKLKGRGLGEARGALGGLGSEFREFVARGNAVDLAVGVSIGTAFSSLMQSFVQNIVSPPLRALTGAISGAAQSAQAGVAGTTGFDWSPPQQGPGAFLGQLGSFAMLALSTFVVVKIVNRFKGALEKRSLETAPDAAPDPGYEDPTTRVISQNDRIIELLEQLNGRQQNASSLIPPQ